MEPLEEIVPALTHTIPENMLSVPDTIASSN